MRFTKQCTARQQPAHRLAIGSSGARHLAAVGTSISVALFGGVRTRFASLLFDLRAQALLLLANLGRRRLAEVLELEHLADLHLLAARERRPLDPLEGLVARAHLPDPEACHQLLGLGER